MEENVFYSFLPVRGGVGSPTSLVFGIPRRIFWKTFLFFPLRMIELVVTKHFKLILFYVYKGNCVSAGYNMLAYIDFTFCASLDITV